MTLVIVSLYFSFMVVFVIYWTLWVMHFSVYLLLKNGEFCSNSPLHNWKITLILWMLDFRLFSGRSVLPLVWQYLSLSPGMWSLLSRYDPLGDQWELWGARQALCSPNPSNLVGLEFKLLTPQNHAQFFSLPLPTLAFLWVPKYLVHAQPGII